MNHDLEQNKLRAEKRYLLFFYCLKFYPVFYDILIFFYYITKNIWVDNSILVKLLGKKLIYIIIKVQDNYTIYYYVSGKIKIQLFKNYQIVHCTLKMFNIVIFKTYKLNYHKKIKL